MNIVAYIHVHSCIEQSGPKTSVCSFAPISTQRTDTARKTCFQRLQSCGWHWIHTLKSIALDENWFPGKQLELISEVSCHISAAERKGSGLYIGMTPWQRGWRLQKRVLAGRTTRLPGRLRLEPHGLTLLRQHAHQPLFCKLFSHLGERAEISNDCYCRRGDDWRTLVSCYSGCCCFNSTMGLKCWGDKLERVGSGTQAGGMRKGCIYSLIFTFLPTCLRILTLRPCNHSWSMFLFCLNHIVYIYSIDSIPLWQ